MNLIVLAIILAIVSLAILKIVKEKKKGAKCIGCPLSGTENSTCNC